MELKDLNVTFRNVLLEEVKEEKIGGIYIPLSASTNSENKTYKVVKVGKLCEEIQPGEGVFLTNGLRLTPRTIEGKDYFIVFENQIEARFTFIANSLSEFEIEEPDQENFNARAYTQMGKKVKN